MIISNSYIELFRKAEIDLAKRIGVIAGSPVDTQMGVDVLAGRGAQAFAYPAAYAAREQTEFQMQSEQVRTEKIRTLLKKGIDDGMDDFMIYCNSLSSTVNMPALSKELGIKIVTPLMAYARYANEYDRLSVIAGNNQGLAGIERAIMGANIKCTVIGASLLPMVVEVEAKTAPETIVEMFALPSLVDFFEHAGAQAMILGCTHFPYIREVLNNTINLPILDPADSMCEMLL
jgi:glutamate racemase